MKLLFSIILFVNAAQIFSQSRDSTTQTQQDAIYNRPFISIGKTRTAVGGYLEGNTNYFVEDGVGDGLSMEMRRFNIFLFSNIHNRIRFLSEIEFEHGTEEIAIETAILDFEFNSALNFRMGILLPSIGLVNTNHDSPNWEFIERPISSTQLIPSTLSEIGFGFFGKLYPSEQVTLAYDINMINGLQEDIILNSEGKTHIPSGKSDEMFGEDNNGTPMFNGRAAINHRKLGEIGLAYYGGIYNRYQLEGSSVEAKLSLNLFAIDLNTSIKNLTLQGELAYAAIDVPSDIVEIYGSAQYAGFIEGIYPILKRKILGFDNAVINSSLRVEYIDYNLGNFKTNVNNNIGDENTGVALGIGFRPKAGTIIRANYRYHWLQDNLGNPSARLAGIQFGFASYF